jgi:hypothetical protein
MINRGDTEHTTETQWYDCSNHCVIFSVFEIPNARPHATHFRLLNSIVALQLCMEADKASTIPDKFLRKHRCMAALKLHMRRIRLTLKQKQEHLVPDLTGFANLITEYLRTNQSKEAFRFIKRLSIVHPTKRDGGIMSSFLSM